MSDTLRGYGPPRALMFSGEAEDFELWSIKFKGYLRMNKLHTYLESETPGDSEKNADIFSMMIQVLDDKSLNLIIRDAPDKGRESFKILKDHYLGTSKPRILSLYTELTSLKMGSGETVTEYMLRAETAASRLKQAEETISDQLLIAMVLKGLPESYKAFSTIMCNTNDKLEFSKFKISLRSYEENEAARAAHNVTSDDVYSLTSDDVYSLITCYSCGKPGHRKFQCTNKPKSEFGKSSKQSRLCDKCKTRSHDTKYCRKGSNNKSYNRNVKVKHPKLDYDDDSFVF